MLGEGPQGSLARQSQSGHGHPPYSGQMQPPMRLFRPKRKRLPENRTLRRSAKRAAAGDRSWREAPLGSGIERWRTRSSTSHAFLRRRGSLWLAAPDRCLPFTTKTTVSDRNVKFQPPNCSNLSNESICLQRVATHGVRHRRCACMALVEGSSRPDANKGNCVLPDDRGTVNRMLLAMPQAVFVRLRPKLELIKLSRRHVIYEADAPIQHVYFLDEGLISYVKAMQDGRVVEIGAVGIEGMTGSNAILGIETAIFEAVVQVPGTAQRLDRKILQDEIARNKDARVLVQRYLHFTISELGQTAACNRLHSLEERCCRWLLIAHDSARSDVFSLTHEFLAMMLGVQRAGVSITASILQRAGFISYKRGRVTIVDRSGLEATACECYAATRAQLDQLFRPSVRA